MNQLVAAPAYNISVEKFAFFLWSDVLYFSMAMLVYMGIPFCHENNGQIFIDQSPTVP